MYCVGHRMRSAWRIHSPDNRIYQGWPALGQQVSPQSTHRVATAAFCRTFHHDGKISPGLKVFSVSDPYPLPEFFKIWIHSYFFWFSSPSWIRIHRLSWFRLQSGSRSEKTLCAGGRRWCTNGRSCGGACTRSTGTRGIPSSPSSTGPPAGRWMDPEGKWGSIFASTALLWDMSRYWISSCLGIIAFKPSD